MLKKSSGETVKEVVPGTNGQGCKKCGRIVLIAVIMNFSKLLLSLVVSSNSSQMSVKVKFVT